MVVGAIASLIGALVLWLAIRISLGEAEGATDNGATDNPTIVYLFAIAMLGMGLTILIGALAGVGDNGERPESMGLPMRILLDGLGHAFGFGFAGAAAFWALMPDAPLVARLGFGFFALLIGGASIYALVGGIMKSMKSTRGR
ncbi:MAG: hypothetical protein R3C30_02590 [Hyphomonadaceae bacterium]